MSERALQSDGEGQGRRDAAVASLRALEALLGLDGSDGAFAAMFQALRPLFGFDHAVVLAADEGAMRCIAADPADPVGGSWAGDVLRQVMRGRVLASDRDSDREAWQSVPPDLVPPRQCALAFPVSVADRRAVLLMTRSEAGKRFNDGHTATARYLSVVALAGSAARSGDRLEGEIQRLNLLVERLRDSEQGAQEDYRLLREIIEQLPCGVTVQDESGRSILVNALAAASLPADGEGGGKPRAAEGAGASGDEDTITDKGGERTWLRSHRRVCIFDRTLVLSSLADITERKKIEDAWTRRAYFDDLTGLPNRLFMQEHVEREIGRIGGDGRMALAFLDIDNFKHINDYYSHAVGDALLMGVATRIAGHMREADILARISGDEFLLLLNPIADVDQARAIVDQILVDIKQPFHVDAYEMFTAASVGVSVYPEHGQSYEALRRNADNAMYRVKSGTKGAALFFDTEMGRSVTARMEHEQQLRLAIRDNRFRCAFQPKVDIYSRQVVGFESLVRWRDENGENRSPGTFIPLAIELGLIDAITHFMLEETLRSIDRLDESFGTGTTFSINLPSKLAGDLAFMQPFIDMLKSGGCSERMMLELTEDAFVATNPFQTQVLPLLRENGVRISIDDFGTGYSSLAALADVTADELKVDRSFITDIHLRPRSQSILRSIEPLGNALGMSIVAEGVETIEELAYLQEATHIRYAQGYYFCKPFLLDDPVGAKGLRSENRGGDAARERVVTNRVRETRGRG